MLKDTLYPGEWWKRDVMKIPRTANLTGGEPILSDAYTINGEPGFLYSCSKKGIKSSFNYCLNKEANVNYSYFNIMFHCRDL